MLYVYICLIANVEDAIVDSSLAMELVYTYFSIGISLVDTFIDMSTTDGSGKPSSL
jgi:hypothetical protein